MLEVKAWIVGKWKANAALVAAVGSTDRIEYAPTVTYPIVDFPRITYIESNQPSAANYDNAPIAVESTIEAHVWTAPDFSATPITRALDAVMIANLFNVDFSEDFGEPETRINHRVLRYRRLLTALDLV
jgi:hypothetical protein